jgi:hypothetical protein
MRNRTLKIVLAISLIFGFAAFSWATPITNTSNDSFEDYPVNIGSFSIGDRFAYYQNTGQFMFIGNYNNEPNLLTVQADVISWLNTNTSYDTTGFTLLDTTSAVTTTGFDYDGNVTSLGAAASGTYQVDTTLYPGGIEFYAIKAGNDFAMYLELGGEVHGSWSTFDLWDYYRLEGSTRSSLEISHFTGYNGSAAPVPEPATMLLLGTGLAGLAGARKKFKKK